MFCEREIARKDERRIEMSIGLARFPFVRDLAGSDFAAQPSIDKSQVREREQHAPRVSEPPVEPDATVRLLRLEIGRCLADLESHVLLPYAAALVVSRPSA